MKESARYVKIVEWSDADKRYVGSCPGLFYGGCHGQDDHRRRNATRWSSGEANGAPATFAPPWPPLIGGYRFFPHR